MIATNMPMVHLFERLEFVSTFMHSWHLLWFGIRLCDSLSPFI